MLKYCIDRYKTEETSDKVVESYLLAIKFVPDWFIMGKKIEKLDNAVFSNEDIVFGDIDSDIVRFFIFDIGLHSINLNNVNLDEDNFDDMILKLLIMLSLWFGVIDISNTKHVQKR